MSEGSARVSFVWGDGEAHDFRLALKQLRELQDKTDAGPYELYQRISAGKWRVEDLRQVIRLGLIGGGLEPIKAMALVERYVDDRPLLETVPAAKYVLYAALVGEKSADDDPDAKKAEGIREAPAGSPSAS